MNKKNQSFASIVARHESLNDLHHLLLSFHGIWAVTCWLLFLIQWIRAKGTFSHKMIGKFILFAFLIPLELTGLFLCPYLFLNIKRDNILLSSGHLVVPSMGFLFIITTYKAFQNLHNKYLNTIIKYVNAINISLQTLGSVILFYKIFFGIDRGIDGENNLELFLLTAPFTLIEIYLANQNTQFDHIFYAKYLTLQMFPGSMIVLARDNYWFWDEKGLYDSRLRILMENLPMIPLYYSICSNLIREKNPKEKVN